MTIWIDPPLWAAHERLWSHLISDSTLDELHTFAAAAGLPPRGFEGDHYDVPQERYHQVVAAGACPTDSRDLVRRLQGSGLRVQKRRHERVISSDYSLQQFPTVRVDVVASRQDDAPAGTVEVRFALVRHTPDAQLLIDGAQDDLPCLAVDGRPDQHASEYAVGQLGMSLPPLVGYVRFVASADDVTGSYQWPTPRACFVIRGAVLDGQPADAVLDGQPAAAVLDGQPAAAVLDGQPAASVDGGRWLAMSDAKRIFQHRHWWPLVQPLGETRAS